MKKFILLVIPFLMLINFGCCTVPSTPNISNITIESPPKFHDLDFCIIEFTDNQGNVVQLYGITSKDGLLLFLDKKAFEEYTQRAYNLINRIEGDTK